MSTYVGTSFSRDVALTEPALKLSDFGAPGLTSTTLATFLAFTGEGAADITNATIESISLQGQSVEPGIFHVSTADTTGEYLIDATINDVQTGIVLTLAAGAKNIAYTYSLGKLIIDELPAGTGTFKVGTKSVTATIAAVASGVGLSVEFDDIGKPDMTWNGAYEFDTNAVKLTYNKLDATNLKQCLSVTLGADAADKDVATINDLEVSEISIVESDYAPATSSADGSFKTLSVTLKCPRVVVTTHDGVISELLNVELPFVASAAVTLPTAFIDATSTDRIAVRVPATAVNDVTLASATDVTISGIKFVTPSLVFPKGGCVILYTPNVSDTLLTSKAGLKSILDTGLVLYNAISELSFEEQLRFRDGYKPAGKKNLHGNTVVHISGGITFYDQIIDPYQDNVLNISKDAGFTIPVAEDGVIKTKYVRISDIYGKIKAISKDDVVDLPDRLHALEVALCHESSDVLDSSETEAERLHDVKDKYSVLDISAIA